MIFYKVFLSLFLFLTGFFNKEKPVSGQSEIRETCPSGYVMVPGNKEYNLADFCVMKYDAKCINTDLKCVTSKGVYKNNKPGCTCEGDYNIISTPKGAPVTYIPEDDKTKTSAKTYCNNIGAHLITNNEWMTIARNVEQIGSNWCSKDGTGCGNTPGAIGKILANGHNDSIPNKALEAGPDNMPCFGTTSDGSNICGGKSSQKRTLTLSNGETIWDLAGNVWTWIDMEIKRKDEPQSKTGGIYDYRWQWSEFSNVNGTSLIFTNGGLLDKEFRPSNPQWSSKQGVGMVYHFNKKNDTDETLYTNIRGGNFRHGKNSGIFTSHFSPVASKKGIDDVGFRCVTNPI